MKLILFAILSLPLVGCTSAVRAADPPIQYSRWPVSDAVVVGRLAIHDHGMQQGARVLSVVVELRNQSGHALNVEFDPHDLHLEISGSDGGRVDEDAAVMRSGPVPSSHRMTISAGAYAGLPTHRGGVGLPVGQTLLAAGWQTWTLPPGTYMIEGTVKIAGSFGDATLDPLLLTRDRKKDAFPLAGQTKPIEVAFSAASFAIDHAAVKADAAAVSLLDAMILIPFHWIGIHESRVMLCFAVFGDLILLGVLAYAGYLLIRRVKYGGSKLRFRKFPYFLGEPFEADMTLDRSLLRASQIEFTLR